MSRPRHDAAAWADSVHTEPLRNQSLLPWRAIHAAIGAQIAHGAGALADPVTDSLCDQATLPTQPGELADTLPALPALPGAGTLLLLAAAIVAAAIALSALLEFGIAR